MQRTLQRAGRERDAEAARAALLDAAQEIFARDGFSGARVDDIAHLAGYNKALIFHYFGDKLGLYRALTLRAKQQLSARFEDTLERLFSDEASDESSDAGTPVVDAPGPASRLHALVSECLDALFDLCAERPQIGRILAWEAAEGWQAYVGCAPALSHRWPQRALALLREAQAAGVARPELDPKLLLTTMVSLPLIHLVSLPRFAAMFPDADFTSAQALAHAREQMTELLLCGILTPAARTKPKARAQARAKPRANTHIAARAAHPAHPPSQAPLAHRIDHTDHTNRTNHAQDSEEA